MSKRKQINLSLIPGGDVTIGQIVNLGFANVVIEKAPEQVLDNVERSDKNEEREED